MNVRLTEESKHIWRSKLLQKVEEEKRAAQEGERQAGKMTKKRWIPRIFFRFVQQKKMPANLYSLKVTRLLMYRGKICPAKPGV